MFQLELVWNREFHFVPYGNQRGTLEESIAYLKSVESMGDGAIVKKTRIVDDTGGIVYAYGKRILKEKQHVTT